MKRMVLYPERNHNSFLYWSCILLILSVFSINGNAQTRKKKVTKKPTQTIVAKPTVKQINKKCAIYSWKKDVRSVQVTKDYIYYVEANENNAVMAIDRKTGDLKTIIPGIAGIYEGARPRISQIKICGERVFFQLVNPHGLSNECGGVYVYDGKSVETSPCLSSKKTGTIIVGNDNYLLTDDCDESSITFWDVKTLKPAKRIYNAYNVDGWIKPDNYNQGFIAANGSVWCKYREDHASCFALNGKSTDYDITKEPYVFQENQKSSSLISINQFIQAGDYLYVSCKRRIYRMNLISPGKWEEYAKMPPTIDNRFEWFCPDAEGNLLTRGVSSDNNNTLYWKVGSFDSPQPIGKDIETGFNDWGYTKIWENLNKNFMDADGNLISHNGSNIYIYNPNGVVGYTNVVGKIVKL